VAEAGRIEEVGSRATAAREARTNGEVRVQMRTKGAGNPARARAEAGLVDSAAARPRLLPLPPGGARARDLALKKSDLIGRSVDLDGLFELVYVIHLYYFFVFGCKNAIVRFVCSCRTLLALLGSKMGCD
jgi:hypothetical protein